MPDQPPIVVRAFEPDDVVAINEIFNQRQVAAMTLQIPFMTVSERQERWKHAESQRTVVAEIDGRLVGAGSLNLHRGRRSHVGSIGMAVREECQGRGVGNALVATLIDLADNWHNLRRLELEVYTDNAAAIHLYEKHGFVIEGAHRDYAYRLGVYVDAYSMARFRNDSPTVAG